MQSNGTGKWTIVAQSTGSLGDLTHSASAPPPIPAIRSPSTATNALFNSGSDIRVKLNKAASANTASFLYQDGFSGRAEIGLSGDDNFHFKVSADGSTWVEAVNIDASTGAVKFANSRTAVSDANYSALVTDRLISYTALTTARVVTLPTASSFPTGTRLVVVDESGNCSRTSNISLTRSGSDTINGATNAMITGSYGYLAIVSNGIAQWTIVDRSTGNSGILTNASIGNFIFTPGGDGQVSIYRCDVTHTGNPRTSTISTIASDAITLSGSTDAYLFYNALMAGVS